MHSKCISLLDGAVLKKKRKEKKKLNFLTKTSNCVEKQINTKENKFKADNETKIKRQKNSLISFSC